jgi:hypothetical protein
MLLTSRFSRIRPAARRFSLAVIGCVLVIDLIWLPFSALRFSSVNVAVIAAIAAMFLLAGPIQKRYEFSAAARHLAVELYVLVLFVACGFVFSYLAIESGWSVRDELFVAIDHALGFDWETYTLFVLQNDLLRTATLILYVVTPPLVIFTLFWSCLKGNFNCASEMVAMVILGGALCVVISGIVPSAGGAGYFPVDNSFYGGHTVIFDDSNKIEFFQLRNRVGLEISLMHPLALIAFPSYHACLALLVVLAFWRTGVLGYTILALNIGSLLSLPVQGGHHLSDVLGGLLVGAATYWVVSKMRPDIGSHRSGGTE